MPVRAKTNLVSLRASVETVYGETPASPIMQELRMTGETIAHKKKTAKSDEISVNRTAKDILQTGQFADGALNIEFTYASFDLFLEGLLGYSMGAGTTFKVENVNLDADTADDSYNRASGSFVTDGFGVGQWVYITGFVNAINNGYHKITALTGTKMTCAGENLVTETSAAGRTITGYVGQVCAQVNLDAVASDDSFNRASGSFVTDGFVVGQWVKVAGFSNGANNGYHKITALTATKMTVGASALVDESSASGRTIIGKILKVGTAEKSYLLERALTDINKFLSYRGMKVDTLTLSLKNGEKITGSISFTGQKGISAGATISGSVRSKTNTPVMVSGANLGSIKEGGTSLTDLIMAMELSIKANNRYQESLGNLAPTGIAQGDVVVEGKIDFYVEDLAKYDKFQNHTTSSFEARLTDASNNVIYMTIPKLYYQDGAPNAPAKDQDVPLSMPFEGVEDPATLTNIQFDLLWAN